MITLTAGMIKTFEICPEKYNLIYNKHIEIPSKEMNAEIGQQLHSLINYRFKGFDITKITEILAKPENIKLKELYDNFLSLKISECVESEFTFNIPAFDNVKLKGRIDAIIKTDNGYEISDWKTGKSTNIETEKDWQTIIYLFGIYNLFKYYGKIKDYSELSMTYYFLKENKKQTIKLTETKYNEYKNKLENICKKILFLEIKNSQTEKCNKCSFNIICKNTYRI